MQATLADGESVELGAQVGQVSADGELTMMVDYAGKVFITEDGRAFAPVVTPIRVVTVYTVKAEDHAPSRPRFLASLKAKFAAALARLLDKARPACEWLRQNGGKVLRAVVRGAKWVTPRIPAARRLMKSWRAGGTLRRIGGVADFLVGIAA